MHRRKKTETKRRAKPAPVFKLKPGTPDIKSIDWKLFDERLPSDTDPKHVKKRKEIFRGFDPNGNGYLSLAEIEKGLMTLFHYGMEVKRVVAKSVQRAHRAAKDAIPSKSKKNKVGDDYVEISEFRIFIMFLRYDLQILTLFLKMDTSDDLRLSYDEFKTMMPLLCKETGMQPPEDPKKAYSEMDADSGGLVLYDEFADYMMKYKVANPSKKLQEIFSNSPKKTVKKALAMGKSSRVSVHKPEKKTPRKTTPRVKTPVKKMGTLPRSKTPKSSSKSSHSASKTPKAPAIDFSALLNAVEEKLAKHIDNSISEVMEKLEAIEKRLSAAEKATVSATESTTKASAEIEAEPSAEAKAEPSAEVPAEPSAEVKAEPSAEVPAEPSKTEAAPNFLAQQPTEEDPAPFVLEAPIEDPTPIPIEDPVPAPAVEEPAPAAAEEPAPVPVEEPVVVDETPAE